MRSSPKAPKPSTVVTVATEQDLSTLVALKGEVVDAAYGNTFKEPSLDAWKARFCTSEYFAERFQSTTLPTTFLLAGPREVPCGMAAFKVRDRAAYFGDLYVRERSHGVGQALFDALVRLARDSRLERAYADVFSTSPGVRGWLERQGFCAESGYDELSLGIWVDRLTRPIEPVASLRRTAVA